MAVGTAATTDVRNLGVDVSYVKRTSTTQQARQSAAALRTGRFAFLRRFGGKVAAVARGGPRASMVFGVGVQGCTDQMLSKVRSTTGACAFGPLGGASLTLRYMLSGIKHLDPAYDILLQPVKLWATAVWSGTADQARRMAVAFKATADFVNEGGNLEKRPPGPTVAVLMALDRLKWKAVSFKEFVTDRGVKLNLSEVCPRSVVILGRRAVEQWQWRRLAEHYPVEYTGFAEGGDLEPLRKELGKQSTLTTAQRGLVKCAATRRLWPSARRAEAGYQLSALCEACQEEPGTIRHVLYRCPATAAARHHRNLGPIAVTGSRSSVEHHLFTRGCMPDLRYQAASPVTEEIIEWDPQSGTGLLEGHVFLDGSRLFGEDEVLARAGWGLAMVRVVGRCEARAWGPYPGVIQCIDAAEVFAATMALRLGVPPMCLYSDSAFFVNGWERGKAWCVAPGRAHADVWLKFWRIAEEFGGEAAITVTKVKAHATQSMVDEGLVDAVDKFGNDMADAAAKKGVAMHPPIDTTADRIRVSRHVAGESVRWLGVGLEDAQRCGAMPAELTQAQKRVRPLLGPRKRLEVIRDQAWWSEHLGHAITEGAHPSHALAKLGPYFFCSVCGHHGAQRLVALRSPCPRQTTPSRKYLLGKLLAGLHPRTGEHLGDIERVEVGGSSNDVGFSATMRRGA